MARFHLVLAMIMFITSMDASKRLVAAGRSLEEDRPPNFGFPELSPPFPRIPIWPPATDSPGHDDKPPNFGFPELSPPFSEISIRPPKTHSLAPKLKTESESSDLADHDYLPANNYDFPEHMPPIPRIPTGPPETHSLAPALSIKSRSSDIPDLEDRPPNFGFPELSPRFPEIPIWPPETDLPRDFKTESRSSLPPVSESL